MPEKQSYRYFDFIVGLFVAVLIISNITSIKFIRIAVPLRFLRRLFSFLPARLALTFDGGTILFPVSYIFGDILTEVYGYAHSRRAIWTGFGGLAVLSLTLWAVGALPAAPGWTGQAAYRLLMATPRIAGASFLGYFAGEFANSTVLSRMKILTRGRWLWTRTIGSTAVGELADSLIFYTAAFAGTVSTAMLTALILTNYLLKTGFEILATPATYAVTGWLKRAEQEDKYDYGESYNPFRLE